MDSDLSTQVTTLLKRFEKGEKQASDDLFGLLHGRLRGLAGQMMQPVRADHTLQPTALVNEVWLRLAGNGDLRVESRQHFMRIAAQAMRSILVDHARRRSAEKRRQDAPRVPLDHALAAWTADRTIDPLVLEEALVRLSQQDERLAQVVELRFFLGLSLDEVADVLKLTQRQVQHAWKLARAWLQRELD